MTKALEEVLRKVRELPDEQQDALALLILAEIDDEARWVEAFAGYQDVLERLAREALSEYRAGSTLPLDVD